MAKVLKVVQGVSWEELDETCGDCIDPDYALEQLKIALPKLNKEQRHELFKAYISIIEKERKILKENAGENKFIKVTPQRVDDVISIYLKKVQALAR